MRSHNTSLGLPLEPGASAVLELWPDPPGIPRAIKITANVGLVVVDIKVGKNSQTAMTSYFYHWLLDGEPVFRFDITRGPLSVRLFNPTKERTPVSFEAQFDELPPKPEGGPYYFYKESDFPGPLTAPLAFANASMNNWFHSLTESATALVSGKISKPDLYVAPGQSAEMEAFTQVVGRVGRLMVLPGVAEDAGRKLKLTLKAVTTGRNPKGAKPIDLPGTERVIPLRWIGGKLSCSANNLVQISDRLSLHVENGLDRPVSWLEFMAILNLSQ